MEPIYYEPEDYYADAYDVTSRLNSRRLADPNAPKKPPTAFMAFSNDNRANLIAKHPEHAKNIRVIASMLGLLWKQLSEAEKNAYKDAYAKKKAEYDVTLREYYTANPETKDRDDALKRMRKQSVAVKRSRGEGSVGRPRKPLTPFFCFVQRYRPTVAQQNPSTKPPEITRKLGEMWRELSDEDKRPYVLESERDGDRFRRECEQLGIEPPSEKRARLAKQKAESQARSLAEQVYPQYVGASVGLDGASDAVDDDEPADDTISDPDDPVGAGVGSSSVGVMGGAGAPAGLVGHPHVRVSVDDPVGGVVGVSGLAGVGAVGTAGGGLGGHMGVGVGVGAHDVHVRHTGGYEPRGVVGDDEGVPLDGADAGLTL